MRAGQRAGVIGPGIAGSAMAGNLLRARLATVQPIGYLASLHARSGLWYPARPKHVIFWARSAT